MCSIIIVDDIPLTLEFIRHHLEFAGFKEIQTYENPFGVVDFLQAGVLPSVIITDFEMPQMNGLELLEIVHKKHGWIPAVVTTADPQSVKTIAASQVVLQKGTLTFVSELLQVLEIMRVPLQTQCTNSSRAATTL